LNKIGVCHTCGATDPGTKTGNFVGDHQANIGLLRGNESQDLYPQCLKCSQIQGGVVGKIKRQAKKLGIHPRDHYLSLLKKAQEEASKNAKKCCFLYFLASKKVFLFIYIFLLIS